MERKATMNIWDRASQSCREICFSLWLVSQLQGLDSRSCLDTGFEFFGCEVNEAEISYMGSFLVRKMESEEWKSESAWVSRAFGTH